MPSTRIDDVAAHAHAVAVEPGHQPARPAHLDALVDLEALDARAGGHVRDQRADGRAGRRVLADLGVRRNERARALPASGSTAAR